MTIKDLEKEIPGLTEYTKPCLRKYEKKHFVKGFILQES